MVGSANGPVVIVTVEITDTLDPLRAPLDTVPARAVPTFRWHAEPGTPGATIVAYRYKLDEPDFVEVAPWVETVVYNTGVAGDVVAPGTKVFTLKAIDSFGAESEITRYFRMNRSPETWIAGPDTGVLDARFGWSPSDRSLAIADWSALPDLTGSLLSCDSLTLRPAERPERRTFFEIYRDKLYVRSELDTVHMNSWVVFHAGGSDPDSPYDVAVEPFDPALDDTLACAPAGVPWTVRPAWLVGSPVAFQSFYGTRLDPTSMFSMSAQSLPFPVFDPASVFRAPVIGAYAAMALSGKAYFSLRAVDADGAKDTRITNAAAARTIVEAVEGGTGTPQQIALRPKILTFHVNRSPFLLFGHPAFVPRPNYVFATRELSLNLLADDSDPLDPANPPPSPGGPSPTKVLRWNVKAIGRDASGTEVTYAPLAEPVFAPQINLTLPPEFVDPHVTLEVELCDCATCEVLPGSGRCVIYSIPVVVPDAPTPALVSLISAEAVQGSVRLRWEVHADASMRIERRRQDSGGRTWARWSQTPRGGSRSRIVTSRRARATAIASCSRRAATHGCPARSG